MHHSRRRGTRALFSADRFLPLPACVAALALCAAAPAALAAPEEIQVYLDDMSAPGQFGVDVHNNYALSARGTPGYAGEQPPRHVLRVTPEFYYGLTPDLELGLYLLGTRDAQGNEHYDGTKLRLKYIAPHDATQGPFWGLNLEVGRTDVRVSETRWNAELKGILGYRTGPWTLALNPNLDWSPMGGGGPVALSLDGKVGYAVSSRTMLGFETYNEFGPLARPEALNRNAKTLYAVIDQEVGRFDINAGIGRGLTPDADRWVAKVIVGTHF